MDDWLLNRDSWQIGSSSTVMEDDDLYCRRRSARKGRSRVMSEATMMETDCGVLLF